MIMLAKETRVSELVSLARSMQVKFVRFVVGEQVYTLSQLGQTSWKISLA